MTAPAIAGEMCRLVVCGPTRQIEMAVPAHVLLADLLPALLHHLGDDLAETGLVQGGWVLQRTGGAPLAEDSSLAGHGLRDGDVVHLRPRTAQLAPVDFDDLIDGVATGVQTRSGRWRAEMSEWSAIGALALVFAVVLVGLGLPGSPAARVLCAGVVTLGCLVAALVLARGAGQRPLGMAFAVAAVAYAWLGAAIAPNVLATGGQRLFDPAEVFCAAVAATSVTALGALLVGWGGPFFAGFLAGGLVTVPGAGLVVFGLLTAVEAAGVVAVAATVVVPMVPLLAFRLARLRLAPLPTEPEHLQEDIDPEPAEPVLAGAAAADHYMTGLYTGLGLPVMVGLALVGRYPGWVGSTLVGVVAVARLLSARPMTSAWHRLAAGLPAVVGLGAVILAQVAALDTATRLAALLLLLFVAVPPLVLAARFLPGRRLMPYWGHVGDITQTVATIAMLPLLLALLGVYGFMRALGG